MATLKETVFAILKADAEKTADGTLGCLLGYNAGSKANCVFFMSPPENITLPVLTYYVLSEGGNFPHDLYVMVTCWGGDYEAVMERVRALLHNVRIDTADFAVKMCKYEWSSADIYDDNLKVYTRRDRYWLRGVKI